MYYLWFYGNRVQFDYPRKQYVIAELHQKQRSLSPTQERAVLPRILLPCGGGKTSLSHIFVLISFTHFTEYLNSQLPAPIIRDLGSSVGYSITLAA